MSECSIKVVFKVKPVSGNVTNRPALGERLVNTVISAELLPHDILKAYDAPPIIPADEAVKNKLTVVSRLAVTTLLPTILFAVMFTKTPVMVQVALHDELVNTVLETDNVLAVFT